MYLELREVAGALHGIVNDPSDKQTSMFYRVFPLKANEPRRWNLYIKSTKPHGSGDLKLKDVLNTSGSRSRAL